MRSFLLTQVIVVVNIITVEAINERVANVHKLYDFNVVKKGANFHCFFIALFFVCEAKASMISHLRTIVKLFIQ